MACNNRKTTNNIVEQQVEESFTENKMIQLLLKDIKVTMNDNYPHYLEYKKQRYPLYSYAKISYKATDFLSSSKKFPDTKAIHYF